jgi:phytoene dehydrogenase-like protein
MQTRNDTVVVIGAGVAGLTAAAWLARKGVHVAVFEAATKVGGCCGTTELQGYRFNDGAQFLMLPQMMAAVFRELEIDASTLALRRVRTPLLTELTDGTRVQIDADLKVSCLRGRLDTDRAEAELQRMLRRWGPVLNDLTGEEWLVGTASPLAQFWKVGRHLPKFARSLEAELDSCFAEPAFRSVMAGHLLFAGGPPRRFMAPSIIALVSVLADGLFLPELGMGQVPATLAAAVERNGGTLHLDASVSRIRMRDGRVHAVEADGVGAFECRAVISTASPLITLGSMLGGQKLPTTWRRRVGRTRFSMKAFSVQLGLANKIDTPSHLNYVLPSLKDQEEFFAPRSAAVEWGYYAVPTVVMPGLAPAEGSLVELYPPVSQSEPAEAWDAARRDRLAESAIEWLRSRHSLEIAVRRVRSPFDFQTELHLPGGAIYGVDPAAGPLALFPQRAPLPGLFLAGQSTFPGFGVPTAALSGLRAARLAYAHLTSR